MRILLLLAAILLVGCAAAPPIPPLAEDAPGSPREYSWQPMKWVLGQRLTYRIDEFHEARVGDRTTTGASQETVTLAAVEQTAKGWMRVAMSVGTQQIGSMLMDEGGQAQDVIAATPAMRSMLERLRSMFQPIAAEMAGRTLKMDERVTVSLEWKLLEGAGTEDLGRLLGALGSLDCWFAGYKWLATARVAAIRCVSGSRTTAPGVTLGTGKAKVTIGAIEVDAVAYHDAARGHLVDSFMTMLISAEAQGQHITMRVMQRQRLDH